MFCSPTDTGFYVNGWITALDCLVLLSSILSTIICGRSLIRSFYLKREVGYFFKQKFGYKLKWKDFTPLFNMWFVGVIISSALAMLGSFMKIILSYQACLPHVHRMFVHAWVALKDKDNNYAFHGYICLYFTIVNL